MQLCSSPSKRRLLPISTELRKATLTRKKVMLESEKLRQLLKQLSAYSESEAIRMVIDDRLFSDEVMKHILQLRCRITVRATHKSVTRDIIEMGRWRKMLESINGHWYHRKPGTRYASSWVSLLRIAASSTIT